jgi:hypothetical protein
MTVIGRPIDPWERGRGYVLGWRDECEIIGPIDVSGLEIALAESDAARAGTRASPPDLLIVGREPEVQQWFHEWAWGREGHKGAQIISAERRSLTIRDNQRNRWYLVDGAWIRRAGATMSSTFTLVVENVRESTERGW